MIKGVKKDVVFLKNTGQPGVRGGIFHPPRIARPPRQLRPCRGGEKDHRVKRPLLPKTLFPGKRNAAERGFSVLFPSPPVSSPELRERQLCFSCSEYRTARSNAAFPRIIPQYNPPKTSSVQKFLKILKKLLSRSFLSGFGQRPAFSSKIVGVLDGHIVHLHIYFASDIAAGHGFSGENHFPGNARVASEGSCAFCIGAYRLIGKAGILFLCFSAVFHNLFLRLCFGVVIGFPTAGNYSFHGCGQ